MRTRLGSAVLAVLAGLLLCAAGGLTLLAGSEADWHRLIAVGGYGVAVGALLVAGYGLAATAPVWLRVIVSVGLPLLAVSVWQAVTDAIDRHAGGWHGPATAHLAAGVLLLVFGLVESRRAAAVSSGYQPTHR